MLQQLKRELRAACHKDSLGYTKNYFNGKMSWDKMKVILDKHIKEEEERIKASRERRGLA